MRRVRTLALAVGLALGVGGVTYLVLHTRTFRSGDPGGPAAQPVRPTRATVGALGRLAPRGEIISVSAPEGDRVARLAVQEGQQVRAGDVLADLESRAERRAERERAASRLAEAETRLATETAHAAALVEESIARLRQLETVPMLEIQVQESRILTLRAELENLERDLARFRELRSTASITQQDLERQDLAVQRQRLDLNGAVIMLDKLRHGHALDVRLARAQLDTARSNLSRIRGAAEVDSLRESLKLANTRLERSEIRAPVSGRILKIITRPGEETGRRAILRIGDVDEMHVLTEVYETDVAAVRTGQRATVTSPALRQPLGGVVVEVGRLVSRNVVLDVDPAAAADRRVVEVRIRLDDSAVASHLVDLQVLVEIAVAPR
jgi:HlyD family secretion protein